MLDFVGCKRGDDSCPVIYLVGKVKKTEISGEIIMNDKPAFGTKEWASRNENSIKSSQNKNFRAEKSILIYN